MKAILLSICLALSAFPVLADFKTIDRFGREEHIVQLYPDAASFPAPCEAGLIYADQSSTPNELYWCDPATGLYAQVGGAAPLGCTCGDVKDGFQAADHSGWIKLDGRPISSLTLEQQSCASFLGFASALPNAAGAYAAMGGTVGVVTGSNSKTIFQANLPAVNLTAQSAGAHTHTSNATGALGQPSLIYRSNGGNNTTDGILDATVGEPNLVQAPAALTINSGGAHTHTVPLGGSGSAFDVTPRTLGVNKFACLEP